MRALLILSISFVYFSFCLKAQSFHETGQYNASDNQFLPDLYFTLMPELKQPAVVNGKTPRNSYQSTIVKVVSDDGGKVYHLVLQYDLMGSLVYVGCSRNVIEQMGSKPFQSPTFINCIRTASDSFSTIEKERSVLNCFLEILNKISR
jgi:hypothetical protein